MFLFCILHLKLPVYNDFEHLQKSWARPREATAPHLALSVLKGAAEHVLVGVTVTSPTFAVLAGAATYLH